MALLLWIQNRQIWIRSFKRGARRNLINQILLGYEGIKRTFVRSLASKEPVPLLLVGPPGQAKTMFLKCILEKFGEKKVFFTVDGNASKSGLIDVLDDYCQKITTSLAKRFGKIVFEKLSIDNMVKNHNLAQSILDSTWYRIRQLAACKAEVIIIDPSDTTQRCSCCGSMPEKKIDLKVRVYKCSSCGLVLNRDHNAALEILRKGLEQTHIEKLPLLDKTSKLFRGSMKPTWFMSG